MRRIGIGAALALLLATSTRAHVEADGVVVRQDGQIIAQVWLGVVTGSLIVPLGESSPRWDVSLLAPDGSEFVPDPPAELRALLEAPLTASFQSLDSWAFALVGNQAGATAGIRLRVWFENHYDFTSSSIPYSVESATAAEPYGVARLSVFPNPVQDAAWIRYAMPRRGAVEIELFDLAGRRVRAVYSGPASAEEALFRFSARELAAGSYFLRLRSGDSQITRKLVVRR